MKEVAVDSWNSLNDALFENTWNKTIRRHRSNFAYRGVDVASYKIENSLMRLGKPYPHMEQNLIKQFMKYAHPHVVERNTEWHWLSVGQHHGLPTRLVDWTYSPMVALHFATSNLDKYQVDGAIWKVNFDDVHELLQEEQRAGLKRRGSSIFSVEALVETIPTLDALNNKTAKNYTIGVFFEPPAIDQRIVAQFAYFSALSDPFLAMDDWFKKEHVAGRVDVTKIIIPAALKWEFRDKLDQSNVNDRVLMPGLDGLCAWLKRHYKPVEEASA